MLFLDLLEVENPRKCHTDLKLHKEKTHNYCICDVNTLQDSWIFWQRERIPQASRGKSLLTERRSPPTSSASPVMWFRSPILVYIYLLWFYLPI